MKRIADPDTKVTTLWDNDQMYLYVDGEFVESGSEGEMLTRIIDALGWDDSSLSPIVAKHIDPFGRIVNGVADTVDEAKNGPATREALSARTSHIRDSYKTRLAEQTAAMSANLRAEIARETALGNVYDPGTQSYIPDPNLQS